MQVPNDRVARIRILDYWYSTGNNDIVASYQHTNWHSENVGFRRDPCIYYTPLPSKTIARRSPIIFIIGQPVKLGVPARMDCSNGGSDPFRLLHSPLQSVGSAVPDSVLIIQPIW